MLGASGRSRRAVLFDAAGTLIHLREPVGDTYARCARRHGVEAAPARIGQAFGRWFRRMPPMVFAGEAPERIALLEREWWSALVAAVFGEAAPAGRFADFDAFFAELYDHFAHAAAWRAVAGAAGTLSALRDLDLATGVVSNFDRRLLGILDGLGLTPLLDVVVLPSEAGAAKPSPRIFQLALERLAVAAERTLYIGDDTAHDVEGASAAGLRSFNVRDLPDLAAVVKRIDSLLPDS